MRRPPSLLPPAGSMSPSFFLLLLLLLALPARARREQVPGGAQRGRNPPASSSSSSSSPAAAGPSRFPRSRPDRRRGRLYCRVGIGFHLQLHPDGRVDGAHDASPLSILEIFAVSQGIVGIRGVFSNKFLAMSKKGKLHASARFTVDCHFRERFQENSYNTYASAVHRSPRSGRQCWRSESLLLHPGMDLMPALKYLCHGAGAFLLPGGVPPQVPPHDRDACSSQVPTGFIQQFLLLIYFITLSTFADAGSKVFILQ
ncbi:fibroblast growth factor 5 isoform X1 [Prinia subflava]|uniref:fibroblast growth factor 5 isoform X1 n=1 Tax=Prinia subflava TaxID=208062 RepID=UPI002FE18900